MTDGAALGGTVGTFNMGGATHIVVGPDGIVTTTTAIFSSSSTQDRFMSNSNLQIRTRERSFFACLTERRALESGAIGGGIGGIFGLGFAVMFGFNPLAALIVGVAIGFMIGFMLGGVHQHEEQDSCESVRGRILSGQEPAEEPEEVEDTPFATPTIPEHTIDPYSESTEPRSIFPPYTGRLQPPENNITHVTFTPDGGQEQTTAIPENGLVVGNIRIFRNGTFAYEGGAPTLTNNRITLRRNNDNVLRVTIQGN